MPSSASLACVPPGLVLDMWSQVSGFIERAMRRGGLGDFGAVENGVLAGDGLLWLAHDAGEIIAAAVTSLEMNNGHKVCLIVACGGSGWCRFGHLIAGLENYAKAEGCECVRIIGRKGWGQLLPEYSVTRHVFEKALI